MKHFQSTPNNNFNSWHFWHQECFATKQKSFFLFNKIFFYLLVGNGSVNAGKHAFSWIYMNSTFQKNVRNTRATHASPEIYAVFHAAIIFPTLCTKDYWMLNNYAWNSHKMHFYVNPHVLLTFDRAKQEIRIVEEEYEGFEVSLILLPWS